MFMFRNKKVNFISTWLSVAMKAKTWILAVFGIVSSVIAKLCRSIGSTGR